MWESARPSRRAVMQELMLRHRAQTMLVVCPAGLTVQWRD
jgi:hypothetical protein